MLKKNRSAPNTGVIPVLYYPEVRAAVEWLTTALPLTERLRIADHRCQLSHNGGAIVVNLGVVEPESGAMLECSPNKKKAANGGARGWLKVSLPPELGESEKSG